MTRYVALLRGINLGGHNRVPMAALRATCEAVGCTEVATYIQSGNVALDSPLDAEKLRTTLELAITEQIGVSPAVLIRTHAQLVGTISGNPFPKADNAHLHVAFLARTPTDSELAELARLDHPPEELAVRSTEAYFHLPNGLGRAKLPELFGRRVKTTATVRNWRTVTKLVELSG